MAERRKLSEIIIYGLAGLSLVFFLLARFLPWKPEELETMISAANQMQAAINFVRSCRQEKGLPFDLKTDPNQTGLIGLKWSILTTTLGQLEAKRTTTNPDFAGLIVYLLRQAGVKRGEAVAIGASSSFPALIIASLAACKAFEITPLYIVSLGASQWGANEPRFTWLDIQDCLEEAQWLPELPVAFSLGGSRDNGIGLEPEGKEMLLKKIRERGLKLINEPDLEKNVALRLSLYEIGARGKRIGAFINIGGGWANMGESEEILRLPPGLNIIDRTAEQFQGVVWEMGRRRIPVIHLLSIKGLAEKYGLPWDPEPLPQPGQSGFYQLVKDSARHFKLLAITYFLIALIFLLFFPLLQKW